MTLAQPLPFEISLISRQQFIREEICPRLGEHGRCYRRALSGGMATLSQPVKSYLGTAFLPMCYSQKPKTFKATETRLKNKPTQENCQTSSQNLDTISSHLLRPRFYLVLFIFTTLEVYNARHCSKSFANMIHCFLKAAQ